MPLVRMLVSVGSDDLPSRPGETVQLSADRARALVANGWGEIVRDRAPETPERATAGPERAVERTERATAATGTPEAPETTEGDSSETAPAPRRPRAPRKPKS